MLDQTIHPDLVQCFNKMRSVWHAEHSEKGWHAVMRLSAYWLRTTLHAFDQSPPFPFPSSSPEGMLWTEVEQIQLSKPAALFLDICDEAQVRLHSIHPSPHFPCTNICPPV